MDTEKINTMHTLQGNPFPLESALLCIGKGWHEIVKSLINDLFELGWNGTLIQVKEKYGTLRFYIGTSTEEMENRIEQAWKQSSITCDVCGKPGEVRTNRNWVMTRCNEHDKNS